MKPQISRRQFAQACAVSLGLGLTGTVRTGAVEPFARKGNSRLQLSLAAYSFRQFFKDGNNAQTNATRAEKQIDLFQFIDYCAEQGCAGAEVTSYYFPQNFSNEFLLKLKRHAFLRGVELSGTAVGNTFTHPAGEASAKQIASIKNWIDHAALMGIPHIRVFAGNAEGQPLEAAKKNCIRALEECCAYAGERGVFLGIENHGGIVAEADPLLDIIKSVNSPWLGVNLDTGNFHTVDPYADLERCAPYAVNVQIKTELAPKGKKKENADLRRIVKILHDAKYQGYVVLEYEAAEDPYTAVPRALGELRSLLRA
jgi:sugar phosphate isomerase/epimerase